MKPFRLSALLMFIVLLTGACKKIPVINVNNSFISFKIDGAAKEVKGITNVIGSYSKEESIVQVVGNLAGGEQISLTIGNFHGVGEYTTEEDFLGLYAVGEEDVSTIGTEGKIKITEFTEGKSIKGEFQFKGEPFTIRVGEGNDPDQAPPVIQIFSDGKFEAKISYVFGPIVEPG